MKRSGESNVSTLVAIISLVGFGAGVIMLGIVYFSLMRIHKDREKLDEFQVEMTRLITQLDTYITQGRDDIDSLLGRKHVDPDNDRWLKNLSRLISTHIASARSRHKDVATALSRLEFNLSAIKKIRSDCARWNSRHHKLAVVFPRVRKSVQSLLLNMRNAIISLEGRQRLQRAVQIRSYWASSRPVSEKLVNDIISNLGSDNYIFIIKTELSDLMLLYERLLGEDHVDNFADIRDNQFKPTIERLRWGISLLENQAQAHPHLSTELLNQLEKHLFGMEFRMDNIPVGNSSNADGLYILCRERLNLKNDREALKAQVAMVFDRMQNTRQQLLSRTEDIANRTTVLAEGTLVRAWRTMLYIWLFSMTLFLFLSVKIFQSVRRQVKAIETSNKNLKIEIMERRRVEEELRNSREALSKAKDELEMRVDERTAELRQINDLLEKEISEKRRAEEELKQRSLELSTALDATRKARRIAESERDKSEKMLAEMTESKRRLEILISDATAREKRMVELKTEVNDLLDRLGEDIKYAAPIKVDRFLRDRSSDFSP